MQHDATVRRKTMRIYPTTQSGSRQGRAGQGERANADGCVFWALSLDLQASVAGLRQCGGILRQRSGSTKRLPSNGNSCLSRNGGVIASSGILPEK